MERVNEERSLGSACFPGTPFPIENKRRLKLFMAIVRTCRIMGLLIQIMLLIMATPQPTMCPCF
jgi:hypothetical protein